MMGNEYGLLLEWGVRITVGIAIAVIASRITVWFAFRRFVSEKLWEKRAEAYGAILEALHDMKRAYDEDLNAYERGREIPERQKEELHRKYQEGKHELNRRVEVEQFFLSDNLLTEISALNKNLKNAGAAESGDWYLRIEESWVAIDGAQKKIRGIAKDHLAVR